MSRVLKYPAPIAAELVIDMPEVAHVLSVQVQRGQAQIWALVHDDGSHKPRTFLWIGTGHTVPEPIGAYVGSVQFDGGALVFHLFEAA